MEFYVINKRNREGKLVKVIYSQDANSAEMLLNLLGAKYILTCESVRPLNAPEFSINDHVEEMLEAEEKARQCNKCCRNCHNFYESYGFVECMRDNMPEDATIDSFSCKYWS